MKERFDKETSFDNFERLINESKWLKFAINTKIIQFNTKPHDRVVDANP